MAAGATQAVELASERSVAADGLEAGQPQGLEVVFIEGRRGHQLSGDGQFLPGLLPGSDVGGDRLDLTVFQLSAEHLTEGPHLGGGLALADNALHAVGSQAFAHAALPVGEMAAVTVAGVEPATMGDLIALHQLPQFRGQDHLPRSGLGSLGPLPGNLGRPGRIPHLLAGWRRQRRQERRPAPFLPFVDVGHQGVDLSCPQRPPVPPPPRHSAAATFDCLGQFLAAVVLAAETIPAIVAMAPETFPLVEPGSPGDGLLRAAVTASRGKPRHARPAGQPAAGQRDGKSSAYRHR